MVAGILLAITLILAIFKLAWHIPVPWLIVLAPFCGPYLAILAMGLCFIILDYFIDAGGR